MAIRNYLARGYALIAGCTVLTVLLTEAATLYARLANARAIQARGEADRLISVGAATAAIAHELRQPLTAVAVNSETVRVDLDEVPAVVADIIQSNNRAANIITSIRDLLKRDAHNAKEWQINELVQQTLVLCGSDLRRNGILVSAEYAPESACVVGDRNQLQQVFSNLIMNAIDAMKAQPLPERSLWLTAVRNGDSLLISIRDSGSGIPTEFRERIFDPFFTTKANGLGSGSPSANRSFRNIMAISDWPK